MAKKRMSEYKKEAIVAACPVTSLDELRKAGKFGTMAGLYSFLKRHKAITERSDIRISFPVGE